MRQVNVIITPINMHDAVECFNSAQFQFPPEFPLQFLFGTEQATLHTNQKEGRLRGYETVWLFLRNEQVLK
jgi:hypothetical protein